VETRGFQVTGNMIHLDSVLNLSATVSWTLKRVAKRVDRSRCGKKAACDKSNALDYEILEYYSSSPSLPHRNQKIESNMF